MSQERVTDVTQNTWINTSGSRKQQMSLANALKSMIQHFLQNKVCFERGCNHNFHILKTRRKKSDETVERENYIGHYRILPNIMETETPKAVAKGGGGISVNCGLERGMRQLSGRTDSTVHEPTVEVGKRGLRGHWVAFRYPHSPHQTHSWSKSEILFNLRWARFRSILLPERLMLPTGCF